MPSVVDRLRKRRFYPVPIDGETVHVRALLDSELKELKPFQNEESSFGFVIGCGLLNDDGTPVYTRAENESPQAFGDRVLAELNPPNDTRTELSLAIVKLAKPPSHESLVKN